MEPQHPPPPTLELSPLEAEKEPMAAEGGGGEEAPQNPPQDPPQELGGPDGGGEKNGVVKVPLDEEFLGGSGGGSPPKFTGLGKEELLAAAGTPPWVKARTFLLLLFWGGWVGMLGAAAAIVANAPRCRPLPTRNWWQLGGLYRAPPGPFGGDLKGVSQHLEHVVGLQMKGLVLGPLHPQIPEGGDPKTPPPLDELDPKWGTLEDFGDLVRAAKKKGLQVLVDVTPNPWGGGPAWLGPQVTEDPKFQEKVKGSLSAWLQRGAGGVFMDGIEELQPSVVAEWRNLTEQKGPGGEERVLVGGTRLRDPPALQALLNVSGGSLILGPFLEVLGDPPGPSLTSQLLQFLHPKTDLAWTVGSPRQHLWGLSPPRAPQLLLLLWTLPGTPTLNYGDEMGLGDPPGGALPGQLTPMPWEELEGLQEEENSTQAQLLGLCRLLGSLRSRERSLGLGEAEAIPAGPASAFLRSWDQSERFLVVLNPTEQPLPHVTLQDPRLPPKATLRLSTHHPPPQDPQLPLGALQLRPYEGLLLSFPYTP